jgi:hypothetical protein
MTALRVNARSARRDPARFTPFLAIRGSCSGYKIEARYISRQGTRTFGWALAAVGMAVSAGCALASLPTETRATYDGGFVAASLGAAVGTLLLTSFFVHAKDEASVVVSPSH